MNAAQGNPVPQVVEMTAGGVDYAFEAIGLPATVRQAVRMTRKGGTIGHGRRRAGGHERRAAGRRHRAAREDDPRLHDGLESLPHRHARATSSSTGAASSKLDEMISARLPLERVNDAFEAMRNGTAARSVVVFD